jgi:hypothetical protein
LLEGFKNCDALTEKQIMHGIHHRKLHYIKIPQSNEFRPFNTMLRKKILSFLFRFQSFISFA